MNRYRLYQANPTTRILGHQTFITATRSTELEELERAYMAEEKEKSWLYQFAITNCFDLIIDVFNLGMIIGIRKERQRRKSKSPANAPTLTGLQP